MSEAEIDFQQREAKYIGRTGSYRHERDFRKKIRIKVKDVGLTFNSDFVWVRPEGGGYLRIIEISKITFDEPKREVAV